MAVRPEVVVWVVLAALLVATSQGADLQTMRVVFEGDHDAAGADDALVVAGGSVDVPAEATANGSIYVVGGDVRVAGAVAGDVVQVDGALSLADTATVAGDLKVLGGEFDAADGAVVRGVREVGAVPADVATGTGGGGVVPFAVQTAVLAGVGFVLGRRSPALLRNVGEAITGHALVSGVVGTLAAVVFAALFVVMAFTVVLIPVSLFGVAVGFLVVGYATVVYGFVLGRFALHRTPPRRSGLDGRVGSRDAGVSTALGVVGFSVLLRLLELVPLVGSLLSLGLVVTGLGAVLVTYFGYRRFEPAR